MSKDPGSWDRRLNLCCTRCRGTFHGVPGLQCSRVVCKFCTSSLYCMYSPGSRGLRPLSDMRSRSGSNRELVGRSRLEPQAYDNNGITGSSSSNLSVIPSLGEIFGLTSKSMIILRWYRSAEYRVKTRASRGQVRHSAERSAGGKVSVGDKTFLAPRTATVQTDASRFLNCEGLDTD